MSKIFLIILFTSVLIFGQFKGDDNVPLDIRSGLLNENPMSSLFTFIDPAKFSINHSFGLSYSSFGDNGMALGVYTNNIAYEFNDKLNIEISASLVNSPYNTLGDSFTNSINGIYLDRARINYRPTEDFNISLQFSNSPFGYNSRYGRRGFSSFSNYWYD